MQNEVSKYNLIKLIFAIAILFVCVSLNVYAQDVTEGYVFNENMRKGDSGKDIKVLQQLFNSNSATQVAISGPGSPGNETEFFGPLTHTAAIKFQEFYSTEVLSPVGLYSGTGFVGPSTRKKLNILTQQKGNIINENTTPVITPTTPTSTPQVETNPIQVLPTETQSSELILMYPSDYSAPPGAKITLQGDGFEKTGNNIHFGDSYVMENISTEISAALDFIVPDDIDSGKYILWVSNSKGESNKDAFFVVTDPNIPEPTVERFEPQQARYGDTITIHGSGFALEGNTIRIGYDIIDNINSSDGKTLSITVAPNVPELAELAGRDFGVTLDYWLSVENNFGVSNSKVLPFNI